MRRTRVVPTMLAAMLAGALVAGCSGSSGGKPTAAGSTGSAAASATSSTGAGQSAAAIVRAAQQKTSTAGSSKIDLTTTATLAGSQQTIKGTGAFDYAANKGVFSLDLGALGAGGTLHERIVDGTLYLSLPGQGSTFYALKLSDLDGTPFGGSADPSQFLSSLSGVTQDVHVVGSEQVRGEPTTHYAGTIDLKTLGSSGGAGAQTSKLLSGTGLTSLPYDTWIDQQGRIVRVVTKVGVPASAKTGGKAVDTTTTVELYDFGTPVDVTAPPKSEVKDGSALLAQLRQATGTSG